MDSTTSPDENIKPLVAGANLPKKPKEVRAIDTDNESVICIDTESEPDLRRGTSIATTIVTVDSQSSQSSQDSYCSAASSQERELPTTSHDASMKYVVEAIRGVKWFPKENLIAYHVKWHDFPEQENTWEPEECFDEAQEALQEFLDSKKGKQQFKRAQKKRDEALGLAPPPRKRGRPPTKNAEKRPAAGRDPRMPPAKIPREEVPREVQRVIERREVRGATPVAHEGEMRILGVRRVGFLGPTEYRVRFGDGPLQGLTLQEVLAHNLQEFIRYNDEQVS